MNTSALSDLENWTPVYQSETWPTGSIRSPLAMAVLLTLTPASVIIGTDQLEYRSNELAYAWGTLTDVDDIVSPNVIVAESRVGDYSNNDEPGLSGDESSASADEEFKRFFSLATVARIAFPDSRPMDSWEKAVTDRIFLSHFK